jgi:hypothetical protein
MTKAGNFLENESKFLTEQISEVFDVITLVDLPFSLGSIFLDKSVSKGVQALGEVEKNYILRGVTDVTGRDIRTEMMLNYMNVIEARDLELMSPAAFDLEILDNMEPLAEYGKDKELFIHEWLEKKFIARDLKLNFADFDKGVLEKLSEGMFDLPEYARDRRMLLPDTRKAVNELVRKNWIDLIPQLKNVQPMQAALDSLENDGFNIMEKLLPFKDVETDFTGELTKDVLTKRFSDIVDLKYATGGATDENMHALRMGYWEDVRAERMSEQEIEKAARLKGAVNPQLDDGLAALVNNEREYIKYFSEDAENSEKLMMLGLERRLARVNKSAAQKVMLKSFQLAFQSGLAGGGTAAMSYMTKNSSEGCIAAIFDTLRDESKCLWNNAEGALCDE